MLSVMLLLAAGRAGWSTGRAGDAAEAGRWKGDGGNQWEKPVENPWKSLLFLHPVWELKVTPSVLIFAAFCCFPFVAAGVAFKFNRWICCRAIGPYRWLSVCCTKWLDFYHFCDRLQSFVYLAPEGKTSWIFGKNLGAPKLASSQNLVFLWFVWTPIVTFRINPIGREKYYYSYFQRNPPDSETHSAKETLRMRSIHPSPKTKDSRASTGFPQHVALPMCWLAADLSVIQERGQRPVSAAWLGSQHVGFLGPGGGMWAWQWLQSCRIHDM